VPKLKQKIILRNILIRIYSIWTLSGFVLIMLILFPLIIIPVLINKNLGNISYFMLRIWARAFSFMSYIRYRIKGKENVDMKKTYIFVSNHTSFLDAPGLVLAAQRQFRPLGKVELAKIPILGYIIKNLAVLVKRSSEESRKKSMEDMKEVLGRGVPILIFPEGTMNRTDKPLQDFYSGAFRLSMESGIEIIPIVLKNGGNLLPPSTLTAKPGIVDIQVCPSLNPKDFKTAEEMSDYVWKLMNEELGMGHVTEVDKEQGTGASSQIA